MDISFRLNGQAVGCFTNTYRISYPCNEIKNEEKKSFFFCLFFFFSGKKIFFFLKLLTHFISRFFFYFLVGCSTVFSTLFLLFVSIFCFLCISRFIYNGVVAKASSSSLQPIKLMSDQKYGSIDFYFLRFSFLSFFSTFAFLCVVCL